MKAKLNIKPEKKQELISFVTNLIQCEYQLVANAQDNGYANKPIIHTRLQKIDYLEQILFILKKL